MRALLVFLSLLAALALPACHSSDDPCGGRAEACLAIELQGDGARPIESLHLHLDGAGLAQSDYEVGPSGTATLPFTSLLVFDRLPSPVTFRLEVLARRGAAASLVGHTDTALTPGEHRRVTVQLAEAAVSDGGSGECPPAMVRIPGQTYCMDVTEVTNAAYLAFLATGPTRDLYPGTCRGPLEFIPDGLWPPPAGTESLPVVGVSWCNAYAFCRAAGKHLCGRIGGGTNAVADLADASRSEWFNACSAGGTRPYPYGASYGDTMCNGSFYRADYHRREVGGIASCEGGYPGLFDLSGNVGEWEDSCDGEECLVRGGSYDSVDTALRCDRKFLSRMYWGDVHVGLRCCK